MRFYITPNLGLPVIQRWQNNHWIFDRWPTDEEIKEEKVLNYNYDINKEFNNKNMPKGKCTESIIISDEFEKYNIDKAIELDNRAKRATWLDIDTQTDWSKITFTKTREVYYHPLIMQMKINPSAIQGDKGIDTDWINRAYEGGYYPDSCICPCCGRSY